MSSMVTKSHARQLLHNKFVVILGGSVQRSMYKGLVVLLQMDHHLTPSQLKSKVGHLGPTLRYDIIEANFYSMKLADFNGLDVVDLHFYFRHNLHHRMPDGIHWDVLAHRRISSLLIKHVSDAWGVELYSRPQQELPQSCWSHRKQQRSNTLDRFQIPPPITAAAQHASCLHQSHHCRLQSFSSTRVRPFSTQSPQPGLQTLPCVRMLQSHQCPQIRAERSHMGLQLRCGGHFHPHFQCDTHFLRRRWRGMVSRSHPYPHHPLRVTSRYASYGW